MGRAITFPVSPSQEVRQRFVGDEEDCGRRANCGRRAGVVVQFIRKTTQGERGWVCGRMHKEGHELEVAVLRGGMPKRQADPPKASPKGGAAKASPKPAPQNSPPYIIVVGDCVFELSSAGAGSSMRAPHSWNIAPLPLHQIKIPTHRKRHKMSELWDPHQTSPIQKTTSTPPPTLKEGRILNLT